MNILILFDIDKTLITTSGYRAAFSFGFKEAYDIDASMEVISYEGMTDQQIIYEAMGYYGLSDDKIRQGIKVCVDSIAEFFKKNNDIKISLIPGTRETLEELDKNNYLLGLVTGNLEAVAKIKLDKAGILDYFKVGGFGSDAILRADLVRLAIKRAKNKYSLSDDASIFVVGDTLRDIQAGIDAKVKTIGVASGSHSVDELKLAGADYAIELLPEIIKIIKTLN